MFHSIPEVQSKKYCYTRSVYDIAMHYHKDCDSALQPTALPLPGAEWALDSRQFKAKLS